MLRDGAAEALIYDEPLLRYLLKDAAPGIEILLRSIERKGYAFVLKPGFPQNEVLNRALLAQTRASEWQEIVNRYLGRR